MSTILAIAPHPDDETLGCGGTLLKHIASGDEVHWLIVTDMTKAAGYSEDNIVKRDQEIVLVSKAYGFARTHRLGLGAGQLDRQPMGELVAAIGEIIEKSNVDTLYLPFPSDAHSDHRVTFDAAIACTKSFRYPMVRRVACCEILSETDSVIRPHDLAFRPNLFINITENMSEKLRIMSLYSGEMGDFPFPRSVEAIQAQARLRGTQAGCDFAEAFVLLKEIR